MEFTEKFKVKMEDLLEVYQEQVEEWILEFDVVATHHNTAKVKNIYDDYYIIKLNDNGELEIAGELQ